MKRWIIIMVFVFAMILPVVTACKEEYLPTETVMIEDAIQSAGSGAACNISIYTNSSLIDNGSMIRNGLSYNYSAGILSTGTYVSVIECTLGAETYLGACNFIVAGDTDMGSIAIVLFILTVTGAVFALAFFKKQFHTNEIGDFILRRCCIAVGVFMMILNSAIIATISDVSGLGLNDEMFRYMWGFGIVGYVFLIYLFLSTLLKVLKLIKIKSFEKRYGQLE